MSDEEGGNPILGFFVIVLVLAAVNGASYFFNWGWYFY